jgi:chromosome segregation protein
LIRRELAGQEAQLKTIEDELFMGKKRLDEIQERIDETEDEIADIDRQAVKLMADMDKLDKDIARRNGDLAGKRDALKKKSAALASIQMEIEKIHLEVAQTDTEIKNIQDNFRETHSRDLAEFEERIFKITESTSEIRERAAEARSQMKDLGQVNLMAPEEFAEVKARYDHQTAQMEDLTKAKADLEKITLEIRVQASKLFLDTYNKVKKNFHNLFRRLFSGGRAELRLVDADHVLESGIEIFAQPPGKKMENIGLLSGGERSMTAIALLFATYMVKPSPFCFLDEIDAAMDENNVGRFGEILREFSGSSQFIVITHNKRTVVNVDTLLGVTMDEGGVTKLVTQRLRQPQAAGVPGVPPGAYERLTAEAGVPPEAYERLAAEAVESAVGYDNADAAVVAADDAGDDTDDAGGQLAGADVVTVVSKGRDI